MELIYQNFDGLEVSFQCAVPSSVLNALEQAKYEAQDARNRAYAEIGPNRLQVMVHETGARGGFTYQFSTGPDGAIWLIGSREERNQWNVRVRVTSLCLALYGYKGTKERILKILHEDLRAKGPDDNDGIPQERVSRVDYCLDYLFESGFNPSHLNFVCAGRTKKGIITQIPVAVEATGQRIEYIRIGKLPNRQVVIYNKTREISAHLKEFWWKIWNLNKLEINGEIWRIEIRAGKKELNKWNLRTFNDLEKSIGDVIKTTLQDYKYTIPNENDKNMTRWPMAEIWINAINAINKDLFSYISNAERKEILNDLRKAVIKRYEKLISGIFVGLTAVTGRDISEIPGVLEAVCGQIIEEVSLNPQKFRQKYLKKMDKFQELK